MTDKAEKNIRFICDDNLGRLARYLRAAGFDTVWERSISDSQLIRVALDENRCILTRDRRLAAMTLARNVFLIEPDNWREQLHSVLRHYELTINRNAMFVRCLEDNAVTITVAKESIRGLVSPFTYETHDTFRQCPLCRRVYWSGTHIAAISGRFKSLGLIAE